MEVVRKLSKFDVRIYAETHAPRWGQLEAIRQRSPSYLSAPPSEATGGMLLLWSPRLSATGGEVVQGRV
eukprot:12170411-Prorocentrum_lima.AAC.1